MKYFLFLLVCFCQNTFSQTSQVNGVIINAADNSKLASASIFINNSSKGTISNADGTFTLSGITERNFELVVSYTGFVSVSLKITPENMGRFQTIKMVPRKEMMEGVSIMVPEKDGWKTWGKFFTECFIGRSDFAKECVIENPKALRFFNDKRNNRLTAYSNTSLIIKNTYTGYTNFQELETHNANKRKRWLQARKEAYYGSIMQFMRAVFADSVAEEGFEVHEKIRIDNTDTLFNKIYLPGNMPTVRIGNEGYKARAGEIPSFKKIPDYVDLINLKNLSFKDAVTFDSSSKQKEFYFDNYIQVVYKNANAKMDYIIANGLPKYLKMKQSSEAKLSLEEPLIIEKDGSYFNSLNMISSGYWGWYKMAEMLPSDYEIQN